MEHNIESVAVVSHIVATLYCIIASIKSAYDEDHTNSHLYLILGFIPLVNLALVMCTSVKLVAIMIYSFNSLKKYKVEI